MRVKRIELLGFKSFATKTLVHFEPGVTAIVGPNGSGKSNIVDAVRWVLGEHNPRDVRAPRLEDIIFNGTDTKAPLSMAEVSLLIENDRGLLPIAFSEVLITRRIYRSGESECFINQSPCRLRDIHELFLGTGLGGSTYAIITQGHIDLVLSSKPEERRLVFEEASGVAKYLAKKQEASRRLDEAEEDLLRLADIISEVKRQLGALERQAAKARQYKIHWEQLSAAELRLAVDELRQGRQRHDELSASVGQLGAQRQALEATRQEAMASLETFNTQIATVHASLQELRAKVVEVRSRIEQHKQQRSLKARWIEELGEQRQQLERETIQLEERLAQVRAQWQQVESEREGLGGQRQELLGKHAATREALARFDGELSETVSHLELAKQAVFRAAGDAVQARNALTKLTTDLQALVGQQARMDAQAAATRQRREGAVERRQHAEQSLSALTGAERTLQEQLVAARERQHAAQQARDEWTGRLQHIREQWLNEQANLKLLEEIAKRDETFPDAVKALLAERPEGVVGFLADLFSAESGYEQALEAALGDLTMAIVVKDRKTLRRCHERLADQAIDAVRFLVLDDCPGRREPILIPGDRFIGRLTQFVRHDPMLVNLAEWLLGRWAVVDDLNALIDGFTAGLWVSRAGDRWDGRCWRLAGAAKPMPRVGLLHRLEQARQHVEALQRETDQVQQECRRAEDECKALASEESSIREQLDRLVPERARAEAQAASQSRELQRLEDELGSIDQELSQSRVRNQELAALRDQAESSATEARKQQADSEQLLEQAQQRLDEVNQRRQQDILAVGQLDAAIAAQTAQLQRLELRLDELQVEQRQAEAALSAKKSQAAGLGARADELAQQIQDHDREVGELAGQESAAQHELDEMAQRVANEERLRDQVLPRLLEAEQSLVGLSKKFDEQSRGLSEGEFKRSRILERLKEVYRVEESTLTAEELASAQSLADVERRALTEQIQGLKAKVEANGPVSLGSVEEYDELAKRIEFLKTQQDDLVKSREDLKATIGQINRTARTQFRDTFAKIRSEFQGYFTKLFNGGQADLILLNEEDVLDSGIEIVARPPGKRLQSISLLSGGERAITAIALLFALFKVRPSPFCILDEIDAPLDEANVDRFTRVLEEFLSLSQFILITHNKKTITKADSLYGVTMEQPGISKLVSVKLRVKRVDAPTLRNEPVVLGEAADEVSTETREDNESSVDPLAYTASQEKSP